MKTQIISLALAAGLTALIACGEAHLPHDIHQHTSHTPSIENPTGGTEQSHEQSDEIPCDTNTETVTSEETSGETSDTSDMCPDKDGDGVCDAVDNCVNTWNPEQVDEDGDGAGASCDWCDKKVGPKHGSCDDGGRRKVDQTCKRYKDPMAVEEHGPGECKMRCKAGLTCVPWPRYPKNSHGFCVELD